MSPCCEMAYSEEADEDFKLPLRPWLEKQIHSGRFKGLEWEREPCEGESKQFRLPWVKKNLPRWEEYYKIFRAWAEHRGRGEVAKLGDSKLKSNFRCALNKSVDFEEVAGKSQLQKQTGNYKVYRILTPKEVREKKRKRSKVQTKQEHFNSDEYKTIDKKSLDVLDSLDAASSSSSSTGEMSAGLMQQPIVGFSTTDPKLQSPPYFMPESEIRHAQMTVCPPEAEEFSSILAISPAQNNTNQNGWPNDVPMGEDCFETLPASKEKSLAMDADQSAKSIILQQLENGGIKREQLQECQVIITYNGEKVLDKYVTHMEKGYRIFYGNQDDQVRLLQMRNTTDEKLADFKLPGIELPPLTQQSHTMSAILDKTDLGLIIRYDPQTLQFYAKRLCQSQVFFFDPHDHSENILPTKLKREQTVPVFSHEKYFMEYLQQFLSTENDTPPEAEIVLTVGVKPKSKLGMPNMRGLKIELIPHALKFFMQNNKKHSNSISLCFSNPTSMENLLRQIHQHSATNFSASAVQ